MIFTPLPFYTPFRKLTTIQMMDCDLKFLLTDYPTLSVSDLWNVWSSVIYEMMKKYHTAMRLFLGSGKTTQ